jgi:hypothetical protein
MRAALRAGSSRHSAAPLKYEKLNFRSCCCVKWAIMDAKETYTERGATMGDKGGKKDKSKMQKQETGKQQQKDKIKHDKQPSSNK